MYVNTEFLNKSEIVHAIIDFFEGKRIFFYFFDSFLNNML